MKYAADENDILSAARRIQSHAHRTPTVTCKAADRLAGKQLFFKCEHLQKVGAFKFRGACNAVMKLDEETARRGVVTHSSGNHAQALALAARLRGIDAHIVMPENATPVKMRAVEEYGARVILCEPTLAARSTTAARVLADTGGVLIPPYDHPDIIAGQGTAALELLNDVPDLDALVAPVGGGGLISGTSIIGRARRVLTFAGEPAGADDAARSKSAGQLIEQTAPNTIADGLLTSLGTLTWPCVRDLVEEVITVDDEAILLAMRFLWERTKLMIEPSAAVAVAALMTPRFQQRTEIRRVGVILSGGNVDLDRLPWK